METSPVTTNTIAFIGLCSEYCHALESARDGSRTSFLDKILKILPRIYIVATDMRVNMQNFFDGGYVEQALDEAVYDGIRRSLEVLMGPDDVYLEVFEEDMKYSDTPIGASVAEGLSDLYQVYYNYIATVRNDAADYVVDEATRSVIEDFGNYWGQQLCNLLRPLNHIRYGLEPNDDDAGYDGDELSGY